MSESIHSSLYGLSTSYLGYQQTTGRSTLSSTQLNLVNIKGYSETTQVCEWTHSWPSAHANWCAQVCDWTLPNLCHWKPQTLWSECSTKLHYLHGNSARLCNGSIVKVLNYNTWDFLIWNTLNKSGYLYWKIEFVFLPLKYAFLHKRSVWVPVRCQWVFVVIVGHKFTGCTHWRQRWKT